MVIGGHECGQGEDCLKRRKVEMDKELNEIQAEMERLEFNMQQKEKVH
jgi:hypothetical protein